MVTSWLELGLAACLAAPTTQPVEVDLRGEAVGAAIAELAGRLETTCVLDESLDRSAWTAPVRFYARHLTGEQALRWLARLAELEAVRADGILLITRPRETVEPAAVADRHVQAAWAALATRTGTVKWVDAPLSRVARDVAEAFGVDLIPHPSLLAASLLVDQESESATLAEVCRALEEQLSARALYLDGAIALTGADAGPAWAHGAIPCAPPATPPASQPAEGPPSRPAGTQHEPGPPFRLLGLPLKTAAGRGLWETLAGVLRDADCDGCVEEIPAGQALFDVDADGTVLEVLEATRLLGLAEWSAGPPGAERGLTVRVAGVKTPADSP